MELPRPVRQAVAMTTCQPDMCVMPKMGSMVPMKAKGVALSMSRAGERREDRAACKHVGERFKWLCTLHSMHSGAIGGHRYLAAALSRKKTINFTESQRVVCNSRGLGGLRMPEL